MGDGLLALGYRRQVFIDNIEAAGYQQWRSLMRHNYRHYAMYLIENFRMGRMLRPEWIRQNLVWHDMYHVTAALKQGKGAFILTAHLGNYDVLATVGAAVGWPLSIISKPVKMRSVEWAWMRQRSASGLKILLNQQSMRDILRVIRSNECLGIYFRSTRQKWCAGAVLWSTSANSG